MVIKEMNDLNNSYKGVAYKICICCGKHFPVKIQGGRLYRGCRPRSAETCSPVCSANYTRRKVHNRNISMRFVI